MEQDSFAGNADEDGVDFIKVTEEGDIVDGEVKADLIGSAVDGESGPWADSLCHHYLSCTTISSHIKEFGISYLCRTPFNN